MRIAHLPSSKEISEHRSELCIGKTASGVAFDFTDTYTTLLTTCFSLHIFKRTRLPFRDLNKYAFVLLGVARPVTEQFAPAVRPGNFRSDSHPIGRGSGDYYLNGHDAVFAKLLQCLRIST